MNAWLLLVLSLPTENATVRMRAWRAFKASGAAVLRDGAYLLPQREGCRLSAVELDVRSAGGTTYLLTVNDADPSRFLILFDRTKDYSMLLADIQACARALSSETLAATTRRVRRLRRAYQQLAEIDFFPSETKQQVEAALDELETALSRVVAGETSGDRIGAGKTLLAAFDLEQLGLNRIAGLVHSLDLGGVQPSEASGVECVLAGLRSAIPDDDQLLQAASAVWDGLLAAFEKEEQI